MTVRRMLASVLFFVASPGLVLAQEGPTAAEVKAGLLKAVRFFHERVAVHGGYVWRTSADLQRREGEAKTTSTQIWIQPPGTPTVGEAFLDAYEATRDASCLKAARDTGNALLRGQLQTGGWSYLIEFDPEKRNAHAYRDVPPGRKKANRSTLDDDTTQSALRFLIRLDRTLHFQDQPLHDAIQYGLDSLLKAQYPNGGFPHWWDAATLERSDAEFPVLPASIPETWNRTWPKDFKGCYVLNDNLLQDVVSTLLFAHETYADDRYLKSAERVGEFIVRAQLPDPQPGWAQQYNARMQPEWARKFEPPAVTGGESQGIMETLIVLARQTGRKEFLEPIPRALAYYRKSLLPNGQLARFYELNTNKPLYFTKDYQPTYDDSDMPTHYGFKVGSKLDRIERAWQQALSSPAAKPSRRKPSPVSGRQLAEAKTILDSLDERGAWVEKGKLKSDSGPVSDGVILSERFAANVSNLSRCLQAMEAQ